MSEVSRLLDGYRLVTAEILYRLPDYPELLQSYLWQEYDLEPKFPVLSQFLKFWDDNLEGPLHSVRIATKRIIKPSEFAYADFVVSVH